MPSSIPGSGLAEYSLMNVINNEETPEVIAVANRTGIFRSIKRYPVFAIAILAAIIFCAIFADVIAPHDPLKSSIRERTTPPAWEAEGSSKFLLGADVFGRDILSRVIHGSRISLLVATSVLIPGTIIGTSLGLMAGYYGGAIDEIIMRVVDFTLALPFILVALVVVATFGQSTEVIILLLILLSWNSFARQVRGETLRLKTMDYVSLAKVAGASDFRIMYRHILPGVMSTILVLASLRVGQLILTESILSFLGAGIPPPTPAWGLMIAEGRDYLGSAWWIAFFPGMAIFAAVLAFNFIGDWLRDWLDPMLRQID